MVCRLCRQPLAPDATLCPHCGHYQSALRNGLLYLAGVAAFFAVVGSAGLYCLDKWQQVEARGLGAIDVRVISLSSSGEVTILNTGGRDIYVSYINFDCEQMKHTRPINQVIRAGNLEAYSPPEPPSNQSHKVRCIRGDLAKQVMKQTAAVRNQEYNWYSSDHPSLLAHCKLDDHAQLEGKARVIYRAAGEYDRQRELAVDWRYCKKLWMVSFSGGGLGLDTVDELYSLNDVGQQL